ncbi:SAM-dependent methyltransferase, partial [Streptomyces sp. SID6041]|nr:SAM-dependent methyltransferase [Streptomyces sp. SID6041]
ASWFPGDAATVERLAAALAALPDQDLRRPDPQYRLTCFVRQG